MTEPFTLPRDVETAYRAIPQKAHKVLAALASGNGLTAEQIRLVSETTDIHLIPARLAAVLTPAVAKTQINGKNPQGMTLDSDGAVSAAVEALPAALLQEPGVQQDILEIVRRQPGEGFGMAALTVDVAAARKTFSVIVPCSQCNGAAVVPCPPCRGTGRVPCQTCRGAGFSSCTRCFGTGMTQEASGQSAPCVQCQQTGKMLCHICNGQREAPCRPCNGQGRVACGICGQSGAQTSVYQVSFKAAIGCEIGWDKIPPAARAAAEKLGGGKIVAGKHAEAYWQLPVARDKTLEISGVASFPVAAVTFSIAGKDAPATVAGMQGRIVEIAPVLDAFVKPGIVALNKLSKGPLAAAALLETACRYRLLRGILSAVSKRPKKAVYLAVKRDYAPLLSDKYVRAAVGASARALQTLGAAPRTKGLIGGIVAAAALAAGYYMTPLRAKILAALALHAGARYIAMVDGAEALLGAALCLFLVRVAAARALQKILPVSVQIDARGVRGTGRQGLLAVPAALIVCLAAAALAPHPPHWMALVLP